MNGARARALRRAAGFRVGTDPLHSFAHTHEKILILKHGAVDRETGEPIGAPLRYTVGTIESHGTRRAYRVLKRRRALADAVLNERSV